MTFRNFGFAEVFRFAQGNFFALGNEKKSSLFFCISLVFS